MLIIKNNNQRDKARLAWHRGAFA